MIDPNTRRSLLEAWTRATDGALAQNNLALYDDLIQATTAGVKTGYRSGYDLETLQNTKKIDEYEITINELNIQLELVKLHYLTKEAHHE